MADANSAQALIERVLCDYPEAVSQGFANNPTAELVRVRLRNAIANLGATHGYAIEGSPGKGRWAETPWIAVFDPLVTTSAQRGFYIVYLFRADGESVYLSLNQGTTEVRDRVGRRYREVLRHQADLRHDLISVRAPNAISGEIDLGGGGSLTRGYEAGNIVALRYARGKVPDDSVLANHLASFIDLYQQLIQQSDALADAAMESEGPAETMAALEGDRFRLHRRVERNRSLAQAAKRIHGTTCQVCGFDFASVYGDLGEGYIEAHHLIPVAELSRRPRELLPAADFAVVCANCHRMLHTSRGRETTVEELRAIVEQYRGHQAEAG